MRLSTPFIIFAISVPLVLTGCHQQSDDTIGYVNADFLYISSNVSGNITQLNIQRGDTIKTQSSLFSLDPMPEQQALLQQQNLTKQQQEYLEDMLKGERDPVIQANEAQLKQAEAKRNLAKETYDRANKLLKKKVISQEKYDMALSHYKTEIQAVNEARANLINSQLASREHQIKAQRYQVYALQAVEKQAKWNLEQKTVTSPTDALVNDVYYRPGEYVPADMPVVSLLSPQYMHIDFFVNETMLSQLKQGQQISFTCDGCSTDNQATINYIDTQAQYTPPVIYSDQSRSKLVYEVHAKLPEETAFNFHPGQPVQIHLTTGDS